MGDLLSRFHPGSGGEGEKLDRKNGRPTFSVHSPLPGRRPAMSYRKSCPRTLDRPIMIFGLEPEDLVLVGLVAGIILFAIDAIPAVLTGAAIWVGLSRIKAGKPAGY